VAMGRAIVRRPSLFLFDEPLSNLDAALRAEVRVDIRRLHDRLGATTIYVTHDQVEAMTLADKLWVMNGGVVEQAGAPLDVYEHPRTRFVATFLGSPHMNMIDASLKKEGDRLFVVGGGLRGCVPEDGRFEGAHGGLEVTLGIRPHDLGRTSGPDHERTIASMRVEVIEALGSEAFVHGKVDGADTRLVARIEPEDAKKLRAGTTISVGIDPARIHLFDRASGVTLDGT
jgi:ABC-type sugar transport system ATPase subunit